MASIMLYPLNTPNIPPGVCPFFPLLKMKKNGRQTTNLPQLGYVDSYRISGCQNNLWIHRWVAICPNLPGIRLRGRRQRGRRGVLFTVGRESVRGAAVAAWGSKLRRGVVFVGVSPSGLLVVFVFALMVKFPKRRAWYVFFFRNWGGEKQQRWFHLYNSPSDPTRWTSMSPTDLNVSA